MAKTKEEIQRGLDEDFGHSCGIRTGDITKATEPVKPIAKSKTRDFADSLQEAFDHYIMVDAWTWRGLTNEGKKTALPHHRT